MDPRRFGRAPGRLALPGHEAGPERPLGCVLVVRPAPQPRVPRARPAAPGHRLDVVELEPGARVAAVAGGAHERAPSVVALPPG